MVEVEPTVTEDDQSFVVPNLGCCHFATSLEVEGKRKEGREGAPYAVFVAFRSYMAWLSSASLQPWKKSTRSFKTKERKGHSSTYRARGDVGAWKPHAFQLGRQEAVDVGRLADDRQSDWWSKTYRLDRPRTSEG